MFKTGLEEATEKAKPSFKEQYLDFDRDPALQKAKRLGLSYLGGKAQDAAMTAALLPVIGDGVDRGVLRTLLNGLLMRYKTHQYANDMGISMPGFSTMMGGGGGAAITPSTKKILEGVGGFEDLKGLSDNGHILVSAGSPDAVIAHELGHIQADKIPGFGPLSIISRNLNTLTNPTLGAAAALQGETNWTPALANLAVSSPMLLDEILASTLATRGLIKRKGVVEGLTSALPLIPAFGSYAAHALKPMEITAIRKWRESKEKEKEPIEKSE